MKSQPSRNTHVSGSRSTLALVMLALLSGCASTGDNSISGFDQITLAPGDTGNCDSSPCQVSLKIPPGTGNYEVTANEVSVGTFPAGQTASLGSFWQSQAFAIKGMDAPKAYAYIPVQR
jgi:type 1 fimbria pilin